MSERVRSLTLETLPGRWAVHRLDAAAPIPETARRGAFWAALRSADALTLVCDERIPVDAQRSEPDWAALRVRGPLAFGMTGVLAELSTVLAAAGIPIFALSDYDSDTLLVKASHLDAAVTALREAGHTVDGLPSLLPRGLTAMRRRDRQVADDAWIIALLDRAEYGVLATCVGGQPFAVPRNFVYDCERHCIYLHGARKGRTFETVRNGARAALSVSEMGRLLPAARAMNMSVEFRGVMIYGRVGLVNDPQEATYALHLLVKKYFPHLARGRDYEPVSAADLKVTSTLRLDVEAWSGKEKRGAADHPGAFFFGQTIKEKSVK